MITVGKNKKDMIEINPKSSTIAKDIYLFCQKHRLNKKKKAFLFEYVRDTIHKYLL